MKNLLIDFTETMLSVPKAYMTTISFKNVFEFIALYQSIQGCVAYSCVLHEPFDRLCIMKNLLLWKNYLAVFTTLKIILLKKNSYDLHLKEIYSTLQGRKKFWPRQKGPFYRQANGWCFSVYSQDVNFRQNYE